MNDDTDSTVAAASCRFDACSDSMVSRVVLALVDQMCAEADVDITLLDALEYPLDETLIALSGFGVDEATVRLDGRSLRLDIELARPAPAGHDLRDLLGDAADAVSSFFEIRRPVSTATTVALIGDLG